MAIWSYFAYLIIAHLACLVNASSLTVQNEGQPNAAGQSVEKVKDWFLAPEGLNLRVSCQIDTTLTNHSSNDALPSIKAAFRWSRKTTRFGLFEPLLQNGTSSLERRRQCHLIQPYNPDTGDLQKGLKIACTENLIILKAIRNMDDGFYECSASLSVNDEEFSAHYQAAVLLKIEATSVSTVVVTCVLITVVLIFLLIAICFKMAGHKLTWEKTGGAEDDMHHMDRFMVVEDDFHRRTRTHSMTSNVSGIVFSADPASMVNLIKKLETVDDGNNAASTNAPQVEPPLEAKDPADPEKKISRHLAFMKFISEWTERSKQSRATRQNRPTSRSMRVQRPPKGPAQRGIPRRSSMGILPGSIGIGSGVIMDYPLPVVNSPNTMTKHLSTSKLEEHRAMIKRHPRIRSLTSDTRRSSTSSTGNEMCNIREEPSVIMEIPSKLELVDAEAEANNDINKLPISQ